MYKLLFPFILLFSLTSVVIGEDCNDHTNNALRLKCDLLKDYDKTERPVKHHKESITIGISVHPVEILLSDYDDKLSLRAWMFMNWTDQFLTWKTEDYQDLKKLKLSCSDIWVPDLMSLSILAEDPYQSASFMVCSVQSNGFVEMVYSTSYENYCVADRTYWPYDTHSCSLMLGSRQFLGPTLNFNLEEILPDYLKNDKVWNVKDIVPAVYQDRTGGHENETYTRLELKFTLERHASVKSVTFVYPGLGLAFITLAVLWLEVTSPERIYVLALIIYTDITYLDYFNYLFPASGPKAPMLVCFFRDSVAISGACVILTIISRLLLNTSWKPGWLSAFVRFIDEKSYIQSYLFINTESDINDTKEEAVDNESSFSLVHQRKKEWRIFVTFVDRLIFITFFLIYFILVLKFFPAI